MKSTIANIDPIYLIGAVAVAAALYLNGGENFKAMQQSQASARLIAQTNQASEMKAKLASASADRQSEVAMKRYADGCQMLFASNDPSKFVSIQESKPVLDGTTGAPIGSGAIVCDLTGMTAIIANGVADSLAFSSDRQVIRDAMKRYEGASYNAPKQ